MEDGQDHREGGEIGAESAAMISAEPPQEPAEVVASPEGFEDPEDVDDSGLTGVLAALEEPDPEEPVVADVPQAVEAGPVVAVTVPSAPEAAAEPVAEPVVETPAEAEAQAAPLAEEPAGTPATPADIAVPDFAEQHGPVPIWPFLVYFGLWVVFAGLLLWQFLQTPTGVPLYELTLYGPSILAGLVLTALGPLLAIGVWIMLWLARPGARAGLFSRSLILGAVVTLAGVALWLVVLGAVDMLRLGRLI